MDGHLTMEGFDTSLAEGVLLLTPFSADAKDEKTVNFVNKYVELYGRHPNQSPPTPMTRSTPSTRRWSPAASPPTPPPKKPARS